MTPYDLIPFVLFGALWIGAWRLDRLDARPLKPIVAPAPSMPNFMREFELR